MEELHSSVNLPQLLLVALHLQPYSSVMIEHLTSSMAVLPPSRAYYTIDSLGTLRSSTRCEVRLSIPLARQQSTPISANAVSRNDPRPLICAGNLNGVEVACG